MSGKARQAHRTKNNVRPSSSGRSAELLSSKVSPALVQVGPGNLLPALFPSLASHVTDPPLSNKFMLCFKKFHKKDPITKIKALNELSDLVANSERDEVVGALGSWAHYYPSLTVDVDRKVREATQTVHGAIVRRCGRQVAPHLKRLLPAWLMAQHDEHAPVQRIAHDDLHATFPNEKLAEAIKFCRADICTLYTDNLKGNAEYMLSGKKVDDEEERAAQLARVVGGTLRALRLLLDTLPAAHDDWLWDALLPLLCANGHWKLAAHASPRVRAAAHALTGAALLRLRARLGAELARRAARSLLAPEDAPAAAAERWRALLQLLQHVPDFLDLVDKNLLVKRLCDGLENAAWGEARALAAALPALLALLAPAAQGEDFYRRWFAALLAGLQQRSLLSDDAERDLWSECIAGSLRHATAAPRAPCAARLAHWALGAWLRAALAAPRAAGRPPLAGCTAAHAARLLADWRRLADGADPVYRTMVDDFWENVGQATAAELAGAPPDPEAAVRLVDAHVQLLMDLRRELAAAPDGCLADLERAADAAIGLVLRFAHEHRLVRRVLPAVVPALERFAGGGLLRGLARRFECDSPVEFYERVARAWLADDEQRCEAVVDLAFLLLPDLEDERQDAVFDSFERVSPEAVRWALARALREARGGASTGAARWLRSAAVERALAALVRQHREPGAADLLVNAVAHPPDDGAGLSDAAVASTLGACAALLEAGPAEPDVQLAARLVRALPPARAPAALPLLLALFRMTLQVPRRSQVLSEEAWTDASWAWRDVAPRLPRSQRTAFVQDALQHLHRHLFHDEERLDYARVEHAVSLCPALVAGGGAAELEEHSRLLLAPARGVQPPLEVFALQLDAVWGVLSCPLEDDNEWLAAVVAGAPPLTRSALVAHANRLLFRACYLRELLRADGALLRHRYFRRRLGDALHDYAVLHVLYDHYAFWSHYDTIREAKRRMDEVISEVVRLAPPDARAALAAELAELAAAHGYYWAYAEHHYRRFALAAQGAARPAPEPAADDDRQESFTSELEFVDAPDRTDSRQSFSSSSFEIVDASEGADAGPPGDAANGVAPAPLLLARLRAEVEARRATHRSRAAKPAAKLAAASERAAQYVDLLGDMMLMNGYYHEAQMKALEVQKQKRLAKAKFDERQDAALAEMELTGRAQIFERWSDEPATYVRLGVAVDERAPYDAKDAAMLRAYYCLYASRAPRVDELIADIGAETTSCNLDAVINGYYRHNDTMLFERSLAGASWLQLSATAAVLDLLAAAVPARGWEAPALHWDFTNIALCSALTSLALSAAMWPDDAVRLALVARPALELYVRVRQFIGGVRRECTRRQPAAHVAALPREWADIFAPDATKNVYLLICHVLDGSSREVTAPQAAVLRALTEASKLLEPSAMPAVLRTGQLPLKRAVRAATRALADTCHHGFKYLAYYTLRTLAHTMIETDEAWLAARAAAAATRPSDPLDAAAIPPEDVEAVFSELTLALYDEHLDQLQELVDAALSSYVVCEDICEIVPHSDSHSVVLGHLLLGVALHRHCELARGNLALHYGTVYNAHAYVEGILPAALRLLPPAVAHYMAGRLPALPKHCLPWFIRLRDFDLEEPCSAEGVARLACGAVLRALGGPGAAAARSWCGVQPARDAEALTRLVAAAVAPPLVNHQLAQLQAMARELASRIKVTVNWSARSAASTLRGEEADAPTLRVTLSATHPLHAPRVHTSGPPGPDVHWIAVYLGYRNGRVAEAVRTWAEAVSAELLAGVHCYVCYCRTHPLDGTAPSMHCVQCRNTFHVQCLRRWFNLSNRSNCPVCRTNF